MTYAKVKKCPYICKIYEFGYLTLGNETHVYAILEKLIKSNLTGINFGETPQKYDYKIIMDQIFEGFLCIRSNNYIHEDITLSNVGIGEDKNARIFDFDAVKYFYTTTSDLKYLKNKMEIPNNGSYEIEKYILTPNTLKLINILATFYSDMDQRDKALLLLEECLEKSKQLLGNDHPETLFTMNRLARLYYRIGNMDKALYLIEECLEKCKQKFDNYNPDTLRIIDYLAGLYSDMGHRDKAVPLYEECLEKRKQFLGNDHPDTLQSMFILTWVYDYIGEKDKALALFEECLEKRKQLLGNDHPDTVKVANNLACFYDDIGKMDKAINLRKDYIL
jgi:tetratricopeptide (TPR) repeat protein